MFSYKLYHNNTSTLKLWPFDTQALMPGLQKILLGKIKILDNLLILLPKLLTDILYGTHK